MLSMTDFKIGREMFFKKLGGAINLLTCGSEGEGIKMK
jgi:hypothetical protein